MSRPAGDLEDLIAQAAKGGWDWFEQIEDPKIRQRVAVDLSRHEADRRTIAEAWASFAADPGGRKALQALFDATLNRTVFFTNLGQEAGAMAMWGCFREGQNALALEIARMISMGRETEDKPKPRETL